MMLTDRIVLTTLLLLLAFVISLPGAVAGVWGLLKRYRKRRRTRLLRRRFARLYARIEMRTPG